MVQRANDRAIIFEAPVRWATDSTISLVQGQEEAVRKSENKRAEEGRSCKTPSPKNFIILRDG